MPGTDLRILEEQEEHADLHQAECGGVLSDLLAAPFRARKDGNKMTTCGCASTIIVIVFIFIGLFHLLLQNVYPDAKRRLLPDLGAITSFTQKCPSEDDSVEMSQKLATLTAENERLKPLAGTVEDLTTKNRELDGKVKSQSDEINLLRTSNKEGISH